MYQFKIETQGLNTYLVYEIVEKEEMDTVGIGMLSNNSIKGILPMTQMYIDNISIFKYNISSKVTLKQFFSGKVSKERILKVFFSILESIQAAENYMLDINLLLLQKEEIYINVATSEAELIYFPVLTEKNNMDLALFLKSILFETEFDQSENCDYVTSLLNYLNGKANFSLVEFKRLLGRILNPEVSQSVEKPIKMEAQIVYSTEVPVQQKVVSPVIQPQVAYEPSAELVKTKEKKKIFSFGKKENIRAEKVKVDKVKKEKIKKEVKKQNFIPNMEIPGLSKEETCLPRETTVPIKETKDVSKKEVEREKATYLPQAVIEKRKPQSFGETTVLHTAQAGETTVLGMDDQTVLKPTHSPYLLCKRTGEKIQITKSIFRLGKEKNYADYCIDNNSAVSRSHADIIVKEEECYIIDNNSLNHTYINGEQIASQVQIPIMENSIIKLANEEFEFRVH